MEQLRQALQDMEEGYRERCGYCGGVARSCDELLARNGVPCKAQKARAALQQPTAEPVAKSVDTHVDFERWLRTECFQAPPELSYQLAKAAWKKAISLYAAPPNVEREKEQNGDTSSTPILAQFESPTEEMIGVGALAMLENGMEEAHDFLCVVAADVWGAMEEVRRNALATDSTMSKAD